MDSQKCIWMDAKAVEYQLCPLNHNCDLCDFHKEMIRGCRTHSAQSDLTMLSIRYPDESIIQFQPGLQYIKGHFWYKRVGAGRIQIGIDAFLWYLLASIYKVIIPNNRSILVQNQCFSWLLLEGGIIYLKSPIPGEIKVVNPYFRKERIKDTHQYLSPEYELWLIELEETESKNYGTLTQEQYTTLTKQDCRIFHKVLQAYHGSVETPQSRITQVDRLAFSKYIQMVSDGHAITC